MLETVATVIAIIAAIAAMIGALARNVLRAIAALNRRFDSLEESQRKDIHNQELARAANESRFQQIEYRIETALEYGVNANRELIGHKIKRVERAIANLAGGLERISDGRYKARGPDYWPTDDPPPQKFYDERDRWPADREE